MMEKRHALIINILNVLVMLFLLGCNNTPSFENKRLIVIYPYNESEESFSQAFYYFSFDFINSLSEPIEIISVGALDDKNQQITGIGFGNKNIPNEFFTHDYKIIGSAKPKDELNKIFQKDYFDKLQIPNPGIPLEMAIIKVNKSFFDNTKLEVTEYPKRIIGSEEKFGPSRFFMLLREKYEMLTLKVTYKHKGQLKEVGEKFYLTEYRKFKN